MKLLALSLVAILALAAPAFAGPDTRPDFAALHEQPATSAGPDLRAMFRTECSASTDALGVLQAGGELRYRDRELGHLLGGGLGTDFGGHGVMQFFGLVDLYPMAWLHLGADVVAQEREHVQSGVWLGVELAKHRPDIDLAFKFDATLDVRAHEFGGRIDWLAAGPLVTGTQAQLWLQCRIVAWYRREPAAQFTLALEARVGAFTLTAGATLEKGELPVWIARQRTSTGGSLAPFIAISWRA